MDIIARTTAILVKSNASAFVAAQWQAGRMSMAQTGMSSRRQPTIARRDFIAYCHLNFNFARDYCRGAHLGSPRLLRDP
jgi:hypothetical protein